MSEFENYIFYKNPFIVKRAPPGKAILAKINDMAISNREKFGHGDLEELLHENVPKSGWLRWLYWEPKRDSWLHEVFGSSVIHGMKYMTRRKLCVFERIFWAGAFIASLYMSWVMIGQVYDRYHKSPVIVTFNPTEEETNRLPFPAVTICNKHLFSYKRIHELFEDYKKKEDKQDTIEKLRLVNALCTSKGSFLRRMGLKKPESLVPDWDEINKHPSQETLEGAVKFIFDYTQSCAELLRVCSWDNNRRNCSDLFKPIVTDFGKCCTFNKIPSALMQFEQDEIPGVERRERGWTYPEIKKWSKWNYEEGFVIDNDSLKFPLRQMSIGNIYGLSILVDPGVADGYCQSHDSVGVRILLHTPADMPRITHLGTGFGLDKEIFLKVLPDSTIADTSILEFNPEARKCIFGKGPDPGPNEADINKPYTRNNCYMTCQRRLIREHCNCTLYYARRRKGWRICNPSIYSDDIRCVKTVERATANLKRQCPQCVYGCNYLKYNMEATESTLLDPEELWGDNETQLPPPWANKRLSIIHIYMGSDVNVPKLRQRLFSPVDLIASIGGLLGLTLGFSILAAIEIVYLLTMRLCCKRFRNWQLNGALSSSATTPSHQSVHDLHFPYFK